jgi:hypothetical protein
MRHRFISSCESALGGGKSWLDEEQCRARRLDLYTVFSRVLQYTATFTARYTIPRLKIRGPNTVSYSKPFFTFRNMLPCPSP